jgi:hypothetical protein
VILSAPSRKDYGIEYIEFDTFQENKKTDPVSGAQLNSKTLNTFFEEKKRLLISALFGNFVGKRA